MLLLSKKDIKKVFSMEDAIEADKLAYRLFSEGRSVVPLRMQLASEENDGTFLFMPAYTSELSSASLKIVTIFPGNAEKGMATTQGSIILCDGTTGTVIAILDGSYVTQVRTGAASGAAFDLLARKDAKKGALFGTGGQAPAQLEAMIASRSLEEVRVYSRNTAHVQQFVAIMAEELKDYGTRIVAASSADDAICDADVIAVATVSTTPVFDGRKVKAGATISGVGSYQPHMQELDTVLLQRAKKIYFDSQEAVLSEAGDFIIPLQNKQISETDFTGDLGNVVNGKLAGRERDDEIIVFKSVGIGIQDLVSAKAIYDKAVAVGVGTKWEEI